MKKRMPAFCPDSENRTSIRPPALFLKALITAAAALLLAEVIGYSRNTLLTHLEWISGKRLLASTIMGGSDGFVSRNLLNRNRLNLQEWYGFNEVLLNRVFCPGHLRFRFLLGGEAYLYVVFNKNKDSFFGIRLSRHSELPSMFYEARTDGRFLRKERIRDFSLSADWHTVILTFEAEDLLLKCDGSRIGKFPLQRLQKQVIGFRSGSNRVLIDDVEVSDSDGRLIQRENFRNHRTARVFWLLLFLLVALNASLLWLRTSQKMLFSLILMECSLMLTVSLYYWFDYFSWSQGYHLQPNTQWGRVRVQDALQPAEKLRIFFFTRFPFYDPDYKRLSNYTPQELMAFLQLQPSQAKDDDILVIRNVSGRRRIDSVGDSNREIQSYLDRNPIGPDITILFLGTSQMRGSGAFSAEERIAPRVWSLLNSASPDTNVTVINASKRGSNSLELLEQCKSHLYLFQPHQIIMDLSNNDKANSFREGLISLVEWSRAIRGEPVFVLEANSKEVDKIREKHIIMKKVSAEYAVPLLNLHAYLARRNLYDSGILWWDQVHLTSYGQELAAGFIAAEIRKPVGIERE